MVGVGRPAAAALHRLMPVPPHCYPACKAKSDHHVVYGDNIWRCLDGKSLQWSHCAPQKWLDDGRTDNSAPVAAAVMLRMTLQGDHNHLARSVSVLRP